MAGRVGRWYDMLRRLWRTSARPAVPSLDEVLKFVADHLSGTGVLLHQIIPIHSRIAIQTLDGPRSWFVPVRTTEANSMVRSCRKADRALHVIVWDERYMHHLARLIETHEAWGRNHVDSKSAVRAFAAVAWDFVIDQLCPENRLSKRARDQARVKRVLARIFDHCVEVRARNDEMLHALFKSSEMADPTIWQLLDITIASCRQLTLDHEVHHFVRRVTERDARLRVGIGTMENYVVEMLSRFDGCAVTEILPCGQVWSFFETVFRQVPISSFLGRDFEKMVRSEEVQSDLVPLTLFFSECQKRFLKLPEAEELKLRAIAYQTGRLWQIASAFLQGLRIEVARSIGLDVPNKRFDETDFGLRLMLGDFLSFHMLTAPPYADPQLAPDEPEDLRDPLARHLAETRRIAEMYPRMMDEGPHWIAQRHRSLYLEAYEKTSNHWIEVLNIVGLEISERLKSAANIEGSVPRAPDFKRFLDFVEI